MPSYGLQAINETEGMVFSGNIQPPPAPKKGYTTYYNYQSKEWIWVKKIETSEPEVKYPELTKKKSYYNI